MISVAKIAGQNYNTAQKKVPQNKSQSDVSFRGNQAQSLRLQDFDRSLSLAQSFPMGLKKYNYGPSFGYALKNAKDSHLGYLGANYENGTEKATFRVYSTNAKSIELQTAQKDHDLKYFDKPNAQTQKEIGLKTYPMERVGNIFSITPNEDIPKGTLYRFKLTKKDGEVVYLKDPRSEHQPHDVKGWSATYDHNTYKWTDNEWREGKDSRRFTNKGSEVGVPQGMVIAERHIGLLGGYEKAKEEIDKIADHGVCNTVYFMPVGEFFGKYNQGYDEVDKFAPESSYGKPDELKDLINHAHKRGLNTILDVVPNHFGPIGAVVDEFGNATNKAVDTGWGASLNVEGENGEYMRKYMVDMMMNWLENFHFDGLRLDAVKHLHSDATLKYFAAEIRNHPETRGSVLIPEHAGKTKKLTQPLKDHEVSDPELARKNAQMDPEEAKKLGYDIQYMWDFKNTLTSFIYGLDNVYDCPRFIDDLAKEYEQTYRYYDFETDYLPSTNANKGFATACMHDEYTAFGGVRPVVRTLANELGLVKDKALRNPNAFDKKPYWQAQDILAGYLKGNFEPLKEAGISTEDFEKAYKRAQASNRLMMGSIFMHPAQKGLSFGDEAGELTPVRFFAEYDDKDLENLLEKEKGYKVGKESFEISSKMFNDIKDDTLAQQVKKLTKDLSNIVKENKALQTGDYSKVIARSLTDSSLFVHRWDGEENDIFSISNFDNNEHRFGFVRKFPDGEWEEIFNTNALEYGGSGELKNKGKTFTRDNLDIVLPPKTMAIFRRK